MADFFWRLYDCSGKRSNPVVDIDDVDTQESLMKVHAAGYSAHILLREALFAQPFQEVLHELLPERKYLISLYLVQRMYLTAIEEARQARGRQDYNAPLVRILLRQPLRPLGIIQEVFCRIITEAKVFEKWQFRLLGGSVLQAQEGQICVKAKRDEIISLLQAGLILGWKAGGVEIKRKT